MPARNEAVEHLHGAFNILAPTSKEQTALTYKRWEMERELASDKAICSMIAEAIHEGLVHDNWPA